MFFEPWIDRIAEVGLQFTIPKTGEPVFEGTTPLLTDQRGEYRGNRFAATENIESIWASSIETAQQIARRLQTTGYFGPLGIDAVQYRRKRDGELCFRPLQDINARYTMGRIALGYRQLLQPGETGTWLHCPQPDVSVDEQKKWFTKLQQRLPEGAKLFRTSPGEINGKPVRHGTFVLICSSQDVQQEAERILFVSNLRPSILR